VKVSAVDATAHAAALSRPAFESQDVEMHLDGGFDRDRLVHLPGGFKSPE